MNINPSLEVFDSKQTRVGYAPPGSAATAAARVISGLYTYKGLQFIYDVNMEYCFLLS